MGSVLWGGVGSQPIGRVESGGDTAGEGDRWDIGRGRRDEATDVGRQVYRLEDESKARLLRLIRSN